MGQDTTSPSASASASASAAEAHAHAYRPYGAWYISVIAVVLFWSGAFPAAKYAVGTFPPLTVTLLRFAVAAMLLLAWILTRRISLRVARRDIKWVACIAVVYVVVYHALFFGGLQYAPATVAALIIPANVPLVTTLLGVLLLGERLRWPLVAGIVISAAGVFWILTAAPGDTGTGVHPRRYLGYAMLLAALFCVSLNGILGRMLRGRVAPTVSQFYAAVIGMVLLVPLALMEDPVPALRTAGLGPWLAVLYLGGPATAIAAVMYYVALEHLGVARATVFLYLIPVIATGLSALLLGEQLTLRLITGGTVVLAGVWLANRPPPPERVRTAPGDAA